MELDLTKYSRVLAGETLWLGFHRELGRQSESLASAMAEKNQRLGAVFATSGSSGAPKWVWLEPHALLSSARGVVSAFQLSSQDRCLQCLPDFHVGGFMVALRALVSHSRCFQMRTKWDALIFQQTVEKYRITVVSLVPTQIFDLVRARLKAPDSLRCVLVGGAALSGELLRQSLVLGWPVCVSYGMSEAGSTIAYRETYREANSELTIMPHWHARLGKNSVLEIKGEALFSGYWTQRAKAWRFEPRTGEWFATRDRFKQKAGFWKFLGRIDRVVKILGEQVDLDTLEQSFVTYCQLDENSCFLFAVPDERAGNALHLCLLAEVKDSAQKVRSWNQVNPKLHQIHRVSLFPEFPKTALGKVDQNRLLMSLTSQDSS